MEWEGAKSGSIDWKMGRPWLNVMPGDPHAKDEGFFVNVQVSTMQSTQPQPIAHAMSACCCCPCTCTRIGEDFAPTSA